MANATQMQFADRHIRKGYLLSIVNVKWESYDRPGAEKDAKLMVKVFRDTFGLECIYSDVVSVSSHGQGDIGDQFYKNLGTKEFNHRLQKGPKSENLSMTVCPCISCQLRDKDFNGYDCLVLTISSHGLELDGEAMVSCVDGNLLPISEIYKAINCPSLKGKPKILIIEVCRKDAESDLNAGILIHYQPILPQIVKSSRPRDNGNFSFALINL